MYTKKFFYSKHVITKKRKKVLEQGLAGQKRFLCAFLK